MIDYSVLYIDKRGDKQEFKTMARDVRTAMSTTIELCPDLRRIIRCVRTEDWTD